MRQVEYLPYKCVRRYLRAGKTLGYQQRQEEYLPTMWVRRYLRVGRRFHGHKTLGSSSGR